MFKIGVPVNCYTRSRIKVYILAPLTSINLTVRVCVRD